MQDWRNAAITRESVCWPTAQWQWVYFQGSITHLMIVVCQMQEWIFSKVLCFTFHSLLRYVSLNHWCSCCFVGRYSEGESRYNLQNPKLESAMKEYRRISIKYGVCPAILAIAFVLRHPLVGSAVFGATKLRQLQEVLEATKIHLCEEIVAEINDVHARYPNPCPWHSLNCCFPSFFCWFLHSNVFLLLS